MNLAVVVILATRFLPRKARIGLYLLVVLSLTGGAILVMWLGELITEYGVGNGASLIIMAGIVAQFPMFTSNLFEGGRTGSIAPGIIIGFIAMVVVLILLISFMTFNASEVLPEGDSSFPVKQS